MVRQPNNSMDVRAKQRLCLETCVVTFGLRVGGFAPRHLNRWATPVIRLSLSLSSLKINFFFLKLRLKSLM